MRDFIWQYVDIPRAAIENLTEECLDRLPAVPDRFFQPIDLGCRSFLGLILHRIILIRVKPGVPETIGIHRDILDHSGVCPLAINIPILNCDTSTTVIWTSSAEPDLVHTQTQPGLHPNNPDIKCWSAGLCTPIAEFKLTNPIMWNITNLHSVSNPTNALRVALSLRFLEDPRVLLTRS